jgi:hypothetical protein
VGCPSTASRKRREIEAFANPLPHALIALIVRNPKTFQQIDDSFWMVGEPEVTPP